jgi:hypothetical protein
MSRNIHRKIGAEPILLGLILAFIPVKEKQSHPNDVAASYLNNLSINKIFLRDPTLSLMVQNVLLQVGIERPDLLGSLDVKG